MLDGLLRVKALRFLDLKGDAKRCKKQQYCPIVEFAGSIKLLDVQVLGAFAEESQEEIGFVLFITNVVIVIVSVESVFSHVDQLVGGFLLRTPAAIVVQGFLLSSSRSLLLQNLRLALSSYLGSETIRVIRSL